MRDEDESFILYLGPRLMDGLQIFPLIQKSVFICGPVAFFP